LRRLSQPGSAANSDGSEAARALAQLADERAAWAALEEDLKAQLAKSQAENDNKDAIIIALRKKLDFELELKWERSRYEKNFFCFQDFSSSVLTCILHIAQIYDRDDVQRGLIDTFIETVAPIS